MSEAKHTRIMPADGNRTTTDIEKKFISDTFDSFDKGKNGSLDPNDLPGVCQALDIKPWHLMRYIKTNEKGGDTKVTKEAFLDYWFDPNRPVSSKKSKATKKASKADVVRAFGEFEKALAKLKETVLAAF
mmetsp:Transcript_12967/g.18026  ORF Transcript_12967/g.18026 Transcript_12967/m.18026 type:complete len:130 (+) Transcript_12967:58-447(+)